MMIILRPDFKFLQNKKQLFEVTNIFNFLTSVNDGAAVVVSSTGSVVDEVVVVVVVVGDRRGQNCCTIL